MLKNFLLLNLFLFFPYSLMGSGQTEVTVCLVDKETKEVIDSAFIFYLRDYEEALYDVNLAKRNQLREQKKNRGTIKYNKVKIFFHGKEITKDIYPQLIISEGDEIYASVQLVTKEQVEAKKRVNLKLLDSAKRGDEEGVLQAIDMGADLYFCEQGDPMSSLGYGIQGSKFSVVRTLVEAKVSLSQYCEVNWTTPINLAAGQKGKEAMGILKYLLDMKGQPDQARSDYQDLTKAIFAQGEEALSILLEAKADPNRRSSDQRTPLCVAIEELDLECIEALLKAGALLEGIHYRGQYCYGFSKTKEPLVEEGLHALNAARIAGEKAKKANIKKSVKLKKSEEIFELIRNHMLAKGLTHKILEEVRESEEKLL